MKPTFSFPKPPVILQVLPALEIGGVERGTVDIASAIVESGGRAIVASSGGRLTAEVTRAGAEHFDLQLESKNPFVMFNNIGKLEELILKEKVDIIHARSRAPAWSAWLAARRARIDFITTFHGTYGRGNPAKNYYNSVMIKGKKVIAISEFIAGHVRQFYGVPSESIIVIPRGIDLEKFNVENISGERIISLAKKWRLKDGVPVVMLPGRLTKWKGHMIFIEAIRKLKDRKIACLIVGSDQGRHQYRQSLQDEINRLELSPIIHLIDHCDDMPAAYMLADIVVSASVEPEAFGRVAAEAQSLGRMVIATNHGGAKETIIDGMTGWLVEPGNSSELAEKIGMLMEYPNQERLRFAEHASQYVRDNFSKQVMSYKTLQVYNEVISGR